MSGEENYLEKSFTYRNLHLQQVRRFEEQLYDLEMQYDFESDSCYVSVYDDIYSGLISVHTRKSLKKWFTKYHEVFKNALNLKLVSVTTTKRNNIVIDYKIEYTYKNNDRFTELKEEEIMFNDKDELINITNEAFTNMGKNINHSIDNAALQIKEYIESMYPNIVVDEKELSVFLKRNTKQAGD